MWICNVITCLYQTPVFMAWLIFESKHQKDMCYNKKLDYVELKFKHQILGSRYNTHNLAGPMHVDYSKRNRQSKLPSHNLCISTIILKFATIFSVCGSQLLIG